jgi:hypothetical protein
MLLLLALISGCAAKIQEQPKLLATHKGSIHEISARDGCWKESGSVIMQSCFEPACPQYACTFKPEISSSKVDAIRISYTGNVKPNKSWFTLVKQVQKYQFSAVSQSPVSSTGDIVLENLSPGNYAVRVTTEWKGYGELNYEIGVQVLP